ncbi:MAG: MarR family winged helix-turn-helix transcriptional regulator [Chloroflexota bacterium]
MPAPLSNQPVIDKFWESIPPAWRQTRTQIRRIAFEKFQISVEQFQVLRRIRRGSTSVSTLAEASQTGLSTVSKAVESLVRRGLVVRSSDPLDRRKIPLALTEEGQRVLQFIFDEAEAWLATRFGKLDTHQIESILEGLAALDKAFSSNDNY